MSFFRKLPFPQADGFDKLIAGLVCTLVLSALLPLRTLVFQNAGRYGDKAEPTVEEQQVIDRVNTRSDRDALLALEKLCASKPRLSAAHLSLARWAVRNGNCPTALRAYRQVILVEPHLLEEKIPGSLHAELKSYLPQARSKLDQGEPTHLGADEREELKRVSNFLGRMMAGGCG